MKLSGRGPVARRDGAGRTVEMSLVGPDLAAVKRGVATRLPDSFIS